MVQTSSSLIQLSENFSLEAVDYANQGNSIIGIRGSGKTYTATKIAEGLLKEDIPIIAFDPTGVWQYLKTGVNGNKGLSVVVAGGLFPDLHLDETNATKIVDAALREGVSLVIDLKGIATSNKSKWMRIVSECVEFLMEHNHLYGLRHVFIEEAAEFVPQRPNPGGALVYSRIESMARMGRNFGLGYTLINQRAEEISKAVFEISEQVFLHRQAGKNSLKSISDWLNYRGLEDNNIVRSLPKMDSGTCWVVNEREEVLIKVLEKETFHPDPKKGITTAPKGSHVSDTSLFIERMKQQLSDAPSQVRKKTSTQKEIDMDKILEQQYKDRISELEKQLAEKNKVAASKFTKPQTTGVDIDAIVSEVLKRIPKSSGVAVYEVSPLEKIKQDFLIEAKNKIIDDLRSLSTDAKRLLKYLEVKAQGAKTAEIIAKCFHMKEGGFQREKVSDAAKELVSTQVIRKDTAGWHRPALKERIKDLLGNHSATDQEIEITYNHILVEIIG